MHLRTYVDINYFDCLHVRNSFLNLCRVFLKHPVYITGRGGEGSIRNPTDEGPPSFSLKMETDSVSETLCLWENIGRWKRPKNLILWRAIHHRQNTLQSIAVLKPRQYTHVLCALFIDKNVKKQEGVRRTNSPAFPTYVLYLQYLNLIKWNLI
jgi:hypothetical protein